MTCIFVCFTRFLSQQIAQNLSSKNPEPSRHTIRGYNFQHLNLNLRPKRIAQYTSENNGARIARWAVFNYVRTLFRWSGRPESLQTKSRETSAQNLDGQALLLYSHMCSLSSPKAGSPKFLKIDSRPTNEKTIAEQPSRTVSVYCIPSTTAGDSEFLKTNLRGRYNPKSNLPARIAICLHPLSRSRWPRISKDRCARSLKDCSRKTFPQVLLYSSFSLPKHVAQNFSRQMPRISEDRFARPMQRFLANDLPARIGICLHPPSRSRWPRISGDRFARLLADDQWRPSLFSPLSHPASHIGCILKKIKIYRPVSGNLENEDDGPFGSFGAG